MRRAALLIVFALPLAAGAVGCSSSGAPAARPAPSSFSAAPVMSSPAVPATSTAPSSAPAAPSPACDPSKEPDVIVRYTVPGMADAAQVLGGWNLETCTVDIDKIMVGAPTGSGYCTELAWASDNPGYNADATPAGPLRKVIEAIGGSC